MTMKSNGEEPGQLVLGASTALRGKTTPYPDAVVSRALALMLEHGSVGHAWYALRAELEAKGQPVPDYSTLWTWGRAHQDVIERLGASKKRDMVAMCDDVATAATQRLLQALPNLSDSQLAVPWGIAMQRRTDWENAGAKGPVAAVQFNLVTRRKEED